MKCPVCKDVSLTLSQRQGVEIDYCPTCRGIWLDRGELDKLIERGDQQDAQRPRSEDARPLREPERLGRDDDDQRDAGYRSRPRKSFLRDFFD